MAKRKYKNPYLRVGFLLLALVIACETLLYFKPVATVAPQAQRLTSPATDVVDLPWPATGQAAISIPSYNVSLNRGSQTPAPTASVAKIIMALAVLKQKPLSVGQSGPTITLSQKDVAYYQTDLAQDGSVVAVASGEQLTEQQALQAMLLPSANNMAESLADWAFGSQDAYLSFANKYVKSLGASNTHLADASGFSPSTVSTAVDLTKLAQVAIDNPVLNNVVALYQTDVPVAGTIYNTNWLLNTDGFVGIKTGNTNQAGGCFMFAAKRTVFGQNVTVLGTIMGEASLGIAMQNARTLVDATDSNFVQITAVRKGQIIASYSTPWGKTADGIAASDVNVVVWKGQPVSFKSKLNPVKAPVAAGTKVGRLTATTSQSQNGSTDVVLAGPISKPPLTWRLSHL